MKTLDEHTYIQEESTVAVWLRRRFLGVIMEWRRVNDGQTKADEIGDPLDLLNSSLITGKLTITKDCADAVVARG